MQRSGSALFTCCRALRASSRQFVPRELVEGDGEAVNTIAWVFMTITMAASTRSIGGLRIPVTELVKMKAMQHQCNINMIAKGEPLPRLAIRGCIIDVPTRGTSIAEDRF